MEVIMNIRGWIIDYSRGDNLVNFWRLYWFKQKLKNKAVKKIITFILSRCAHRHGGYIGADTVFNDIPMLPHGLHGIFVSRFAVIGKNCCIYQNVTIGEVNRKAPVIGNNCLIGAGAIIIGDIKIGNNVKIGAGAVVTSNIPDNCTVVSQPARII